MTAARPGLAAALAVSLLASACATAPRAAAPAAEKAAADEAVAAYRARREAAFSKRRFKALFSGDVSPKVGAVARGFLSVWWDGERLTWRVSAPLAGEARSGTYTRGGASETPGGSPFPVGLGPRDAIGVLLGVLDLSPLEARPHERAFRVALDRAGRFALVEGRQVVGLELPHDVVVRFGPGEGVPRRIDVAGPEGRATLKLETYAAWPVGEPAGGPS
ncbi:MAG TPA: hypothetical protein VGR00_07685 [Thermoanaerobaculia bacterium]|nr:hypothetical protein [Thermoanaerobaculia bacterium]